VVVADSVGSAAASLAAAELEVLVVVVVMFHLSNPQI
jgi:hypothetical protein